MTQVKTQLTIGDSCQSLAGVPRIEAAASCKQRAHPAVEHAVALCLHLAACVPITHTCNTCTPLFSISARNTKCNRNVIKPVWSHCGLIKWISCLRSLRFSNIFLASYIIHSKTLSIILCICNKNVQIQLNSFGCITTKWICLNLFIYNQS